MSEASKELATVPRGRYTGERIARLRPRAYRKAMSMLAAGCSVNEICHACRMTNRSVEGIRENEAASITERKASLAGLAARIAQGAGESVENDIASGKIRGTAAVVAFGVATDKLLVLSDQPTARLSIDVSGQIDLVAQFRELTREIRQAVTVDLPSLPAIPPTQAAS